MKKPLIYLDTSVIGGCYDQEFSQWSNGLVEDIRNGHFAFATSEIVALEIVRAPDHIQVLYGDLVENCAPFMCIPNREVLELVDAYLGHGVLKQDYRNDMLHIALCTVHGIDVVVSWNFKHIVRFDKIVKFNAVNIEQGYKPIAIYSPREVTRYGKD